MFIILRNPIIVYENDVIRACHEYYDVVGCIVHDILSHELDADFIEYEVDLNLRHL